MGIQEWTYVTVGLTFALYIGIAIVTRVKTTAGFYVAGQGVSALGNGMATAADWMSAASFISMAGLISFMGYDGAVYLMGWTGGYVLLALLLAPFLRKFGKFTVPDFVGDRYYSSTARVVAVISAIFVSFTYVAGQMRGVGVVFSRFLQVEVTTGVVIGMVIVAFYAVLGGMKGVTYTQIAQYCVLIFAYLVPAIAIAILLTGNPIPQGAIGEILPRLNSLTEELGLTGYSSPFTDLSFINVLFITIALMVGTAGLPHVIVRFYTVKSVSAARWSTGWALLFIAILYTTAPTIAIFVKYLILSEFVNRPVEAFQSVAWVQTWTQTGLIDFRDLNADGIVQATELFGAKGPPAITAAIDRDILVLALPEIARLAPIIIALVAAGGLAAALSTASGLLIVISSAIAHDVYGHLINPDADDRTRLRVGRITIAFAVLVAGYFGINPPGFVAEVVAFAFGLAAASFFPVIILGIFWKRATKEGAILGMITGLIFTAATIGMIRAPQIFGAARPVIDDFLGVNAQGVGTIGMFLNFAVMWIVSLLTPPPPHEVQEMVESIRYPRMMESHQAFNPMHGRTTV
ncbi:MAG: cation acetate symporter [Gemmatimonadota bacterium]|jgi:cation/acetate symporter|nr:cation acetate symporter [Gemmatimonadota bacterium]